MNTPEKEIFPFIDESEQSEQVSNDLNTEEFQDGKTSSFFHFIYEFKQLLRSF